MKHCKISIHTNLFHSAVEYAMDLFVELQISLKQKHLPSAKISGENTTVPRNNNNKYIVSELLQISSSWTHRSESLITGYQPMPSPKVSVLV